MQCKSTIAVAFGIVLSLAANVAQAAAPTPLKVGYKRLARLCRLAGRHR